MTRREEIERMSVKLTRGVFAVLFLSLMLLMVPRVCLAFPRQHGYGSVALRPGQHNPPPGRPRFENDSQPHLGAWLERHRNLSPAEQERALQREPGFNRLPPPVQQRLIDRLRQINSMPPLQRQRTLDHIEALERMSPEQRQQVRASIQQLRELPPNRQLMVRKAFRDLREYPPEQRQAIMSSFRFQRQFTPQERYILANILSAEQHPMPGGEPGPYGR